MNTFTPFALSVGAKRRSRRVTCVSTPLAARAQLVLSAAEGLNANGFIKSSCNHG